MGLGLGLGLGSRVLVRVRFLGAVLANPESAPSPLSSASSSRWTRATCACCATSKRALRSAPMRRRTDEGSSASSRVAPTRNSLVPRAW